MNEKQFEPENEDLLLKLRTAYCYQCSDERQNTVCESPCPRQREIVAAHDATIRMDEQEKLREILSHMRDEDCCGEMNSDECLSYEANCTLCKFDHVVESLRQQEQPK